MKPQFLLGILIFFMAPMSWAHQFSSKSYCEAYARSEARDEGRIVGGVVNGAVRGAVVGGIIGGSSDGTLTGAEPVAVAGGLNRARELEKADACIEQPDAQAPQKIREEDSQFAAE